MAHEGEGYASEVRAASETRYHHVGILARHLHLLFRFEADDCLVEGNVVQHGAERIFAVWSGRRQLYGLRDGRAERAGV